MVDSYETSNVSKSFIENSDLMDCKQEQMQEDVLKSLFSYWKRQLHGAPAILDLPTDRPISTPQAFQMAHQPFMLSNTLMKRLELLSREGEVTLFAILLTAFQVLLFRYTGQFDIIIGTPVEDRNGEKYADVAEDSAHMLLLRSDLSGNPLFGELLKRVHKVDLEARAHCNFLFEKYREEIFPGQDLNQLTVPQVIFQLHHAFPTDSDTLKTKQADFYSEGVRKGTRSFAIALDLTVGSEEGGGSWGVFKYNSYLFDTTTIGRLVAHYQTLLESIAANSDQRISYLPFLSEIERRQILGWDQIQTTTLHEQTLSQLFEAQVRRTPEAMALVFEQEGLTYDELNQRANQLARYLRQLGVGPDVLVGLCLERSIAQVVALLAILKAGGAYVPLDPNYPAERLTFMLEDAHASLMLTWQELGILPTVSQVCLESLQKLLNKQDTTNMEPLGYSENLAYVIYTSGSTGRPKGVAMNQRTLSNLITWQLQSSALTAGIRTLQFASLSFDVSFQEIFSTLASGHTLVLISEPLRRDPLELLHLLVEQSIGRLFLPFVALQQLAETASDRDLFPHYLREVITAGEQLQITQPIARLFQELGTSCLFNHN